MTEAARAAKAELIRVAHDEARRRGDAGYADPATGYFVFTRASLLERGYCCGNGCRHCPYGGHAGRSHAN